MRLCPGGCHAGVATDFSLSLTTYVYFIFWCFVCMIVPGKTNFALESKNRGRGPAPVSRLRGGGPAPRTTKRKTRTPLCILAVPGPRLFTAPARSITPGPLPQQRSLWAAAASPGNFLQHQNQLPTPIRTYYAVIKNHALRLGGGKLAGSPRPRPQRKWG